MKKYWLAFLLLVISSECLATTYTAVIPKDLDLTTPTEGSTKPSEVNNAFREIKTVYLNQLKITAITGTYTVVGTETVIIGSSTSPYLVSFPTPSSVATGTITKEFVIKNRNTGTITLNITVDGVGSPTVTGSQTMCVFSDGTSWFEKRVRTAAVASDADTLDLLDSTYFTNATNLSTGTVNLNRIPGTLTGKSADLLDEQTGSYYTNASNLDSGTVPAARLPASVGAVASGVSMYLSANQSITSGLNVVEFNAEFFDILNEHTIGSTTSNVFTASVAGYYLATMQYSIDNLNEQEYTDAYIYKNGVPICRTVRHASANSVSTSNFIHCITYLNALDTIRFYVNHNHSSACNIESSTYLTTAFIVKLGT